MQAVIARILLRYLAGLLVGWGIIDADSASLINTDPDLIELVTAGIGVALALGTEWAYRLARRFGWER